MSIADPLTDAHPKNERLYQEGTSTQPADITMSRHRLTTPPKRSATHLMHPGERRPGSEVVAT